MIYYISLRRYSVFDCNSTSEDHSDFFRKNKAIRQVVGNENLLHMQCEEEIMEEDKKSGISRRHFLSSAAAITGGAVIGGQLFPQELQAVSKPAKCRQ